MTKSILIAPLAGLLALSPLLAQTPQEQEHPGPGAIVESAPASDWKTIAASDLLIMDLAPNAKGEARRVIIQLMPPPFSQGWIDNIRKLAAAKFWDGTSINRVQDNYVVQWGDAGYDNPESGEVKQKALPDGLMNVPESAYEMTAEQYNQFMEIEAKSASAMDAAEEAVNQMAVIAIEDKMRAANPNYRRWEERDPYSEYAQFLEGWPIANSGDSDEARLWPVHCYGAVGVGRNLSPDTGTGAELYTVIGHAPRHLDRNIAVVGRIIEGMEHLSSLPRGKGQLGFYADAKKRVPIRSIRIGDTLPKAEQPQFEYLDSMSVSFAQYTMARANRRDPFFITPAGGADICNIPVPVRRVKLDR
ncbi:peptidylprolyl isomerase [Parasphingorhabdus sp. JC815]|uniref:peptidylprolyl isomerase n=1 Tax=Parasphingorhabdus sp. JC815 TaxID=3232140 RepID=UPI00345800CD